MGRTYLILVVLAGLFGSLASTFTARAPSAGGDAFAGRIKDTHLDDSSADAAEPMVTTGAGEAVLERSPDGHFYADVQINGATVRALVDTGASSIALSREDARTAGIPVSIGMNEVIGRGADGEVRGEFVTLDHVSLGPTTAEAIPAIILNSGEQSLLGQSFLSKFASVEIQGDRMILR